MILDLSALERMDRRELIHYADETGMICKRQKEQIEELRAKNRALQSSLKAWEGALQLEEGRALQEENRLLRAQVAALTAANRAASDENPGLPVSARDSVRQPGSIAREVAEACGIAQTVQKAADDYLERMEAYCAARQKNADEALRAAAERARALEDEARRDAEEHRIRERERLEGELEELRGQLRDLYREYRQARDAIDDLARMKDGLEE